MSEVPAQSEELLIQFDIHHPGAQTREDRERRQRLMAAIEEESKTLRRCPFCGGIARLSRDHIGSLVFYYAGCTSCEAVVTAESPKATPKSLAGLWNRRITDSSAGGGA